MAWSGVAFVVVFFAGFLVSGFFPPVSPDDTAQQIADRYVADQDRIRAGMVIMMIGCLFLMPFTAIVSAQMARIEGRWTPLTYLNLVAGAVGTVAALFPVVLFIGIAYRPQDRDPELLQALNDFVWVPFIINWPPAFAAALCIATAIFADKRATPVFPRWVAYFLLWAAIAFLPASALPFFYDGLFAWDGLLTFWMAAVFFGSFYLVMAYACLRAISEQFAPGSADAKSEIPALEPAALL
jgi:hypothetical protein